MKAELFEVILSLNNLKLILNNIFKTNDTGFQTLLPFDLKMMLFVDNFYLILSMVLYFQFYANDTKFQQIIRKTQNSKTLRILFHTIFWIIVDHFT